jgi:DNA-binding NarL/FixJ family response regulator
VYNGRELMDYLLKEKNYLNNSDRQPDFIFLDINMPFQNGYQVLQELKVHADLQKIPVYIFSTACSPSDQEKMIGLGAKKCYIKPSAFHDYREIIREVVEG